MLLSDDAISMLEKLSAVDCIPQDKWPLDLDIHLREYLISIGLISVVTLVPPGREQEFYGNHGLIGYTAQGAGIEALRLAKQESHERAKQESTKKKEKASDRRFQAFLVFLGFVLGLIAEHFTGIWASFSGFFH